MVAALSYSSWSIPGPPAVFSSRLGPERRCGTPGSPSSTNIPGVMTSKHCFPRCLGQDAGLLSEAGCPAVADPGRIWCASLTSMVRVVPLVGPSAILLALMASGLNGQRFAFHGYLPTDPKQRKKRITELERESAAQDQTQIFIETPYRNAKLFASIVEACRDDTLLCIAADLTLPTEQVATKRVKEWRRGPPDIEKRPAVFLLLGLA